MAQELPSKKNWIKLKGTQGWKNTRDGTIWKKDLLHKDHWDVMNQKGKKNKKFTTYRKLIKKQVKKQLFFGRYSFTYWGEKIYKYQIRQYVPNRLPINCLDVILITEKEKYENKIIPFNYLDKSEWKEHLKSYLKKFHESVGRWRGIIDFWEFKRHWELKMRIRKHSRV